MIERKNDKYISRFCWVALFNWDEAEVLRLSVLRPTLLSKLAIKSVEENEDV